VFLFRISTTPNCVMRYCVMVSLPVALMEHSLAARRRPVCQAGTGTLRRIAWRGRQASGESRTTKRSAVAAGAREGVVAMMVVVTAVSFIGRAVLCRRGRDQQRDCRREQHPLTA
jgi:hypothetical protein